MATATDVLRVASSYIGKVHEVPPGSNRTIIGRKFGMDGYAWCAEGTSVVYKEAGLRPNIDFPWSAGVAVCFAWYQARGKIVSKHSLRPGDQVRLTISHTEIFERYISSTVIQTIGFNTSSGSGGSQRDGGGCYRRQRSLSVIQYGGRPTLKGGSSGATGFSATPGVLHEGDRGAAVKAMQEALGFTGADVDGVFGPAMLKALIAAQDRLGLEPDGAYGPVTKKALTSKPKGLFDMAGFKNHPRYRGKQKLPKGKWKTAWLNKKHDVSILVTDGKPWTAVVDLEFSGLEPGRAIQSRLALWSYKKGTKTVRSPGGTYGIDERRGSTGHTFIKLSELGKASKGPKGRSKRLRVDLLAFDEGVVLESIRVRTLKEN